MLSYEKMSQSTLDQQYSPSSCIDDIMVYINQYIIQSQFAYDTLRDLCFKNVQYAQEKRAVLDIFVPKGQGPFPVHVFIHGGYWQELSVNESTFAAPNFIDHEIIFIALDYTLAPDATLFRIVEQVQEGFLWILNNIEKYNGEKGNITLSGSSAGGHLVAEILAIDWKKFGYQFCPVKGACEVSGVFDLRPLARTYVNDPLGLSESDAIALSPQFHIPESSCPVIFSYGEIETDEFKRQTQDYMEAWNKAGHISQYIDMPAFNHFDIILELNNKHSPLFKAVLKQILQ